MYLVESNGLSMLMKEAPMYQYEARSLFVTYFRNIVCHLRSSGSSDRWISLGSSRRTKTALASLPASGGTEGTRGTASQHRAREHRTSFPTVDVSRVFTATTTYQVTSRKAEAVSGKRLARIVLLCRHAWDIFRGS